MRAYKGEWENKYNIGTIQFRVHLSKFKAFLVVCCSVPYGIWIETFPADAGGGFP